MPTTSTKGESRKVSEADLDLINMFLSEIQGRINQLGSLRLEYLTAETEILSRMRYLSEQRDATIRNAALRLGIEPSANEGWVYDPVAQAFIKPSAA